MYARRKNYYIKKADRDETILKPSMLAAIIYFRVAGHIGKSPYNVPLSRVPYWTMNAAHTYLAVNRLSGAEDMIPAIREILNATNCVRIYFSTATYPQPSSRPKDFGPPTHWFTLTQGDHGVWSASVVRKVKGNKDPAGVYIKPYLGWGLMTYGFYAMGRVGHELSLQPHNIENRAVPRSAPDELEYYDEALADYQWFKPDDVPPVYACLRDVQYWETQRCPDYAYSANVLYPEHRARVSPVMSQNYCLRRGQPSFVITHHSWGCQLSLYNAPYYALANCALTENHPLLEGYLSYDDFVAELQSSAHGRGMFVFVRNGREYVVHLIERTGLFDTDAVVLPMASKKLWLSDAGKPLSHYKRLQKFVATLPRRVWNGETYEVETDVHA